MANQHNSNRQYKPISGDFYDELEAAATLKQNCEISYRDQEGNQQKIISPIKDLFTENGVEYARLENRIIPLDSIISLNGKTVGGGRVHTEILEEDRMPADAEYISPVDGRPPHEGSADFIYPISDADVKPDTHDDLFKGDIADIGKTGIPSVDNGLINPVDHGTATSVQPDNSINTIHQSEVATENFLGMSDTIGNADKDNAVIIETPTHTDHLNTDRHHTVIVDSSNHSLHPHTDKDDFIHGFTTSTSPFIVGENDMYQLSAHRRINRLDLVVKQGWYSLKDNMALGGNIIRIAPLMAEGFGLLIDLTALTPDADGTLMSPAIGNKNALFNAGLAKVAELVPYNCDTLVHGQDSISVNSVRLRYFKDRLQAENWLSDDHTQVGTPDDMDLN